jgi:thiol-disulfide isomerase/thioredoxin
MDYNKQYFKLFLYPGAQLNITADNNNFEETLKFEGEGSKENNYTLYRLTQIKKLIENTDDLYVKEEEEFKQAMDKVKSDFEKMSKERAAGFDSLYLIDEKNDNAGLFEYLKRYYSIKHEMLKLKGKPSPEFIDYENAAGGKSSLKDFRGKYVYLDNWATWCRPCLGEIPSLKKLEKKYGDKIHFISISLDREKDYDTWKKMIKEENLTGVQLFAHSDKSFADAYKIISIPRFIIVDPEGNVYDPDAPRPSSKKIDALLAELVGK